MLLNEVTSSVSDACLADDSGERADFAAALGIEIGVLDADLYRLTSGIARCRTLVEVVQCLRNAPPEARLWWLEALDSEWCGDTPYLDPNASRAEAEDRGVSNADVRRGIAIGWRIMEAFGITPEA